MNYIGAIMNSQGAQVAQKTDFSQLSGASISNERINPHTHVVHESGQIDLLATVKVLRDTKTVLQHALRESQKHE